MDYNESDLYLAIQLQAKFDKELKNDNNFKENFKIPSKGGLPKKTSGTQSDQEKLSIPLTDPSWELIDPNPDIYSLFQIYNGQFFWSKLDAVVVNWSKTMTLCAGICHYEGRAGMCSVRLSLPLLKLRPRKDLVETLLHEMIHAYLFVTHNNRDRDGHGPIFHEHMYRINRIAGTSISVYHTFHNEVAVYKQHIWKCNGPCQHRYPYYGLLKRSRNRVPSHHDPWWAEHQTKCGGTYEKIKEPENYSSKKRKAVSESKTSSSKQDIRKFLKKNDSTNSAIGRVNNSGSIDASSISGGGSNRANIHKINTGNMTKSKGPIKPRGAGSLNSGGSSSTKTLTEVNNAKISNTSMKGNNSKLPTIVKSSASIKEVSSKENSVQTSSFLPFGGKGRSLQSSIKVSGSSLSAVSQSSISVLLPTPRTVISQKDSNDLENSVILIEDDFEALASIKSNSCNVSIVKDYFPCPLCPKKFTSTEINLHAETHF